MQEIRVDQDMNMLYVTFNASEETDIREFAFELQENCYRLSPGFSCRFHLPEHALLNQTDEWMIRCIENLTIEYGLGDIERATRDEKSYHSDVKRVCRRFDD